MKVAHVKLGVCAHNGKFYAVRVVDNGEPVFSSPLETREEAERVIRDVADSLSADMRKLGKKVRWLDKGSREQS